MFKADSTPVFAGLFALATCAFIAPGCGKKEDGGKKAEPAKTDTTKPTKAEAPKVTKKPLTAEFFGKVVAPPAILAPFKPGMPVAEAKKLSADHWLPQDSIEVEGVKAMWGDQKSMTEVGDTLIELPLDKMSLVAEAWGPGVEATRGGTPVTIWRNPDTGIRAELSVSFNKENGDLRFSPYYPVAKFLGDGPTIAFLPKPILGLKFDEVKAAYPELTDGKYVLMPVLDFDFSGTNTGNALYFDPSDDSGPIKSYMISLDFKSYPPFKEELLALFEKKWGKAKPGKPPYQDEMVYKDADPRIVVEADKRGVFKITVSQK
ncbi:MAG TPA: hypothetical protein PLF40_14685 [Kofleriaceae bacterium]|nr:hypothetical protein [Kofleriaceae bacterium]